MSKRSTARATLEKARFFADHARAAGLANRTEFTNFFEAVIVFGRSVTFHLKKEYCGKGEFEDWYSKQQDKMKEDPLFPFFVKRRNFTLKEGPLEIHKVVSVSVSISATVSLYVEATVIRGKPWYRRSSKILWEDLSAAIIKPVRRWRRQRERKAQRRKSQNQPNTQSTEDLFFNDPKWQERPALDLLDEYLQKLEEIVVEAEKLFGD